VKGVCFFILNVTKNANLVIRYSKENEMKQQDVLKIQNLSKSYGASRGIEGITFSIQKGEIFGFIGPNGAGKSTTIRTLVGLLKPDSGQIQIWGENALLNGDELRRRIGFVPSESNFYQGMKVQQLLEYSCDFYSPQYRGNIPYYCGKMQLDVQRRIDDLSLGNRKKVAIVQALIHKPDLLILDEPTSGLDPLMQSCFYELLKEEQQRGCTIFFSSHTLSEVERLCFRVAIIKEGRIIKVSDIDQLKKLYLKHFRFLFYNKIKEPIKPIQGISSFSQKERSIEGFYSGNIANLLTFASEFNLEDVLLENPALEEIFMHYYSNKGEINES